MPKGGKYLVYKMPGCEVLARGLRRPEALEQVKDLRNQHGTMSIYMGTKKSLKAY